jgi:ribosomal protein L40E
MSTGGPGQYAEHHFRKVIPGDIGTVRQRLCAALEDFHFIVLSENPLQARRPAQKNVITATVLEYDARLTIALRPISPVSTLATFDYSVPYIFGKGDKLTLEREADAIIALATAPSSMSFCPSCGAENMGAVRFCRHCGTPVARNKLPAELEVARLMAGANASLIEVKWGVLVILFNLLITLPMILFGSPKATKAGWILLAIGQLIGWLLLLYGTLRLHRTIGLSSPAQPDSLPDITRPVSMHDRAALPPPPVSITEGTTELINPPDEVPIPVKQARDTGSM